MASKNAQEVYDWLRASGLSVAGALGVMGNLITESNVRPTALGDSGTSYGIAQWHNERWDQLKRWAGYKRLDPSTLNAQKRFLVEDLKGYGLWDQLATIQDTTAATKLVMAKYEKPKDQSPAALDKRVKAAVNSGLVSIDLSSAGYTSAGATATTGLRQLATPDLSSMNANWPTINLPDLDWKGWATTAIFIVGGVALVAAGVIKTVSPYANQAMAQAQQAVGAAI